MTLDSEMNATDAPAAYNWDGNERPHRAPAAFQKRNSAVRAFMAGTLRERDDRPNERDKRPKKHARGRVGVHVSAQRSELVLRQATHPARTTEARHEAQQPNV